MTLEDYEVYHQKGGEYIIPIEIFVDLYDDMIDYKEEYDKFKQASIVIIGELINKNEELQQQLKNCYCNRTDCSGRIKNSKKYESLQQKYDKQLNNWNKLKEHIEKKLKTPLGGREYCCYADFLEKIHELEQERGS